MRSDGVSVAQLELESAEAGCTLDVVRTEEDYRSEQRIIDSIRFTSEQIAAIQEVPTEHCLLDQPASPPDCL